MDIRDDVTDVRTCLSCWPCSNIPLNTYKNKEPHTGKIVSVKRCVGASLPLLRC